LLDEKGRERKVRRTLRKAEVGIGKGVQVKQEKHCADKN